MTITEQQLAEAVEAMARAFNPRTSESGAHTFSIANPELPNDAWKADLSTALTAALPIIEPQWLPIEQADPRMKVALGYQATPGDFENQFAVCWAVELGTRERIWFGAGGLHPDYLMPLPAPPALADEVKG